MNSVKFSLLAVAIIFSFFAAIFFVSHHSVSAQITPGATTNQTYYPVYVSPAVGTINESALPPIGDESMFNYSIPFCTNYCTVIGQNQSLPLPINPPIGNITLTSSNLINRLLGTFNMMPFSIGAASA